MKRVPSFIAKLYENGARGFRSEKRKNLRAVYKALDNLRTGCAVFPDRGYEDIIEIERLVKGLKTKLSVKSWGK